MEKSNEKCHKIMWDNLHLTGDDNKSSTKHLFTIEEWDRIKENNLCFACVESKVNGKVNCRSCPTKLNNFIGGREIYFNSPYYEWHKAKSIIGRKKWAGVIAEMKWEGQK